MRAIIATNKKGYIGKNGGLPWHNRKDLHHFKRLTDGKRLLVGYNTAQTLPELRGRNIVVDDINEIVDTTGIDFCIGGKKTYEKYCHLFTELHISHINDESDGDTTFPDLTNLNPNCRIIDYYF